MCDVSSPIDPAVLSWWHTSRLEALKSQAVCHLGTNFHSFDPPCFCAKVRCESKGAMRGSSRKEADHGFADGFVSGSVIL
jgi:hypothetical protein